MENLQNVKIDREFAELLPLPSAEEIEELTNDLIANGCRDSIKVWQGTIIDGHNRLAICQKHGIAYNVEHIELPDKNAALLWIVRNQFARRNLNPVDRVQLALKFKDTFAAHAKDNQRQSCGRGQKGQLKSADLKNVSTRAAMADIAGVSESTVAAVEFVNKCGSPEIQEQLKNGQISISAAQKMIHTQIEKEQGKQKFSLDWRLVEPRKIIEANREQIRKLKTKLENMTEEAGSIRAR